MTNSKVLLLVLLGAAACDSQVDSNHHGTALASLSGTVRNTRTKPTDSSEVVVVWENTSGSPDIAGADSVGVDGSFPAQFQLSIYEPPDPRLINNWNGVKVGVAFIVAGVPGTDWSKDTSVMEGMLGMEVDHLLVYLPQDIPAGNDVSYLLRGTPSKGFHIYGVHKLTDAEKATRSACIEALGPRPPIALEYTQCGGSAIFDDFVPLDTDLATPLNIDLLDDPSTIDPPNWT
jgi:hypothetical protein